MEFDRIYNSGEIIVPDGSCCEYLIVLIFKKCRGVVGNAIAMLNFDSTDSVFKVSGITVVDSRTNRILEWGDANEVFKLGPALRKNNSGNPESNVQVLEKYNRLYGAIYDFAFSESLTNNQKEMLKEFMDLREELLYPPELDLSRKISPEFFAWVDRVI